MRFSAIDPPRAFKVGDGSIVLKDCARLALEPDEQVTFVTPAGGEHDVTRKSWGFYATASTNVRLRSFGLRAAVGRNSAGRIFVFLVEQGSEADFERYLDAEKNEVVLWLDDGSDVTELGSRPSRDVL